jgi:hypothetical protein
MSNLYIPHERFGRMSPAIDPERCRAEVYESVSRNFSQCARKRAVEEEGVGYCRQHSPAAERARAEASRARYEAERRLRERWSLRPAEYRDALRQIAAGHNDPRALAAAALEKWDDGAP